MKLSLISSATPTPSYNITEMRLRQGERGGERGRERGREGERERERERERRERGRERGGEKGRENKKAWFATEDSDAPLIWIKLVTNRPVKYRLHFSLND